jgi:6-phosphogluconolactonase
MRRWAGQAMAAAGIWALCLATGCNGFFVDPNSVAGGGTGSSTGNYVFVANATTQSLAVFAVGSGTLTPVTGSPFALGFVPTSVAVNPVNTIVYVAGSTSTSSFINAYPIAATGVLSAPTTNIVSSPEVAIAISPDGNWLMALDPLGTISNEALVHEFQIANSSGLLQLESDVGGVFPYPNQTTVIHPMDLKFSPNGAYVFAAMGTGGDVVFPFTTSNGIGQFSTPLWLPPISSTTSEQALAVSPDSTQLYIARSGLSGGLGVYTIGAGGALNQVGSTLAAGQQPISVVVNKAGSDVYVANQIDGTISGYSVVSGMVSVLNPATDTVTSAPRALAIDSSGNYLLSASNSGSPDLTMYSYTTAGELNSLAAESTGTDPTGPVAIATTH